MKAAGQSTEGCPYIEKWLAYYEDQEPSHIERALRKFAKADLLAIDDFACLEMDPTQAKLAFRNVDEMSWDVALDYLSAKNEQAILIDPERGREQGLRQFLDDKSYRPGLKSMKRG